MRAINFEQLLSNIKYPGFAEPQALSRIVVEMVTGGRAYQHEGAGFRMSYRFHSLTVLALVSLAMASPAHGDGLAPPFQQDDLLLWKAAMINKFYHNREIILPEPLGQFFEPCVQVYRALFAAVNPA